MGFLRKSIGLTTALWSLGPGSVLASDGQLSCETTWDPGTLKAAQIAGCERDDQDKISGSYIIGVDVGCSYKATEGGPPVFGSGHYYLRIRCDRPTSERFDGDTFDLLSDSMAEIAGKVEPQKEFFLKQDKSVLDAICPLNDREGDVLFWRKLYLCEELSVHPKDLKIPGPPTAKCEEPIPVSLGDPYAECATTDKSDWTGKVEKKYLIECTTNPSPSNAVKGEVPVSSVIPYSVTWACDGSFHDYSVGDDIKQSRIWLPKEEDITVNEAGAVLARSLCGFYYDNRGFRNTLTDCHDKDSRPKKPEEQSPEGTTGDSFPTQQSAADAYAEGLLKDHPESQYQKTGQIDHPCEPGRLTLTGLVSAHERRIGTNELLPIVGTFRFVDVVKDKLNNPVTMEFAFTVDFEKLSGVPADSDDPLYKKRLGELAEFQPVLAGLLNGTNPLIRTDIKNIKKVYGGLGRYKTSKRSKSKSGKLSGDTSNVSTKGADESSAPGEKTPDAYSVRFARSILKRIFYENKHPLTLNSVSPGVLIDQRKCVADGASTDGAPTPEWYIDSEGGIANINMDIEEWEQEGEARSISDVDEVPEDSPGESGAESAAPTSDQTEGDEPE